MKEWRCDKCGKVIRGPDGCSVTIGILAYNGRGRTTELCGECVGPVCNELGWYRDGWYFLDKEREVL